MFYVSLPKSSLDLLVSLWVFGPYWNAWQRCMMNNMAFEHFLYSQPWDVHLE